MKPIICKTCLKPGHYTYKCFLNQKPIKKIGKQAMKHQQTRRQFINENPGPWVCYLQIHPWCPKILTEATLTIEHVQPKGSHPHLRHVQSNLRPACTYCNLKKGSNSLDKVVDKNIKNMLDAT